MIDFLLPSSWSEPLTVQTVLIRLLLALVLGGFIGIERGIRNRPAGFRTHILVCVGACLVMITNEYISLNAPGVSDPTRMGAQVISGIGFLGVGTIFMTGKNTVKGLTTAAGLWASACVGLAIGIGFYLGGIAATLFIIIVLGLLQKLETVIFNRTQRITIYVEVSKMEEHDKLTEFINNTCGNKIQNEQLVMVSNVENKIASNITVQVKHGVDINKMCKAISQLEGVLLLEIQ